MIIRQWYSLKNYLKAWECIICGRFTYTDQKEIAQPKYCTYCKATGLMGRFE